MNGVPESSLLQTKQYFPIETEMVGYCPSMQELIRSMNKAALVDAPVLISGESGTGKELTALAIHRQSKRAGQPFIPVNCAALPANLFQSEFFGYEKGAFTGASQRKIGLAERADGGTLLLDEIGDLSIDLQVNLLRFLQEGTFYRVGGKEEIQVNVRVLAATHVNLEKAVEAGRFREDLYYRINVLQLRVPPLRERRDDIPLLAEYFLEHFSAETGHRISGFSQEALKVIRDYSWPGNIREFMNRVRRAVAMCEGSVIALTDLGLDRRCVLRSPDVRTLDQVREEAEKIAVLSALSTMHNNISRTALALGTSRVTLYKLIEKYKIST
jgi:DNA-binding NtrC family response regulator